MSEPAYTLSTDKLGSFVMATYICESCNREWYVDASVPNPELCPFCGVRVNDGPDAADRLADATGRDREVFAADDYPLPEVDELERVPDEPYINAHVTLSWVEELPDDIGGSDVHDAESFADILKAEFGFNTRDEVFGVDVQVNVERVGIEDE